jgi:hypothetical protein
MFGMRRAQKGENIEITTTLKLVESNRCAITIEKIVFVVPAKRKSIHPINSGM